ncbi:tetratricopeptide repeat protein [Gorillibacterium massiliense]|uniref:tetratricopeptide repeat protein n=1 Tax=Gorillibacterium massiliense TaxID=1280390 RepID=UPI0004B8D449|nr:tetratricopeptide repeat protein [Gorillibacterium massiliense]
MNLRQAQEKSEILLNAGRPQEAINFIREVLHEAPEVPYFLTALARGYLNLNQIEEAKTAALHSLQVDPEMAWTHGIYALILEKDNKIPEADREFQAGLALEPENTMILANYAFFLCEKMEDVEKAELYGRRLLSLEPDDETHYNLLGHILIEAEKPDEAELLFQEALKINPENAMAHYYAGIVALYRDNAVQAVEHLRNALRLNPESENIREQFFKALKIRNKFYALFWNWSLLLRELGNARFGFLFVLYLLFKYAGKLVDHFPVLMVIYLPVALVFTLFVIYTWIAEPMFNLFIRKGWIR